MGERPEKKGGRLGKKKDNTKINLKLGGVMCIRICPPIF